MGEETKKFTWSDLWDKGKELVTAAEGFMDLDGESKKEFVVNSLVTAQMTFLNVPFIPDPWERQMSRIAIEWMVESIVKLLAQKGVIHVEKYQVATAATA